MFEDVALPGGAVDVGVDFGGEDALVTEHFLDSTQVGAIFYEVGGERMAEGVRGYFLADSGLHRVCLYHLEHRDASERTAETVQEKDVGTFAVSGWSADFEIVTYGVACHATEGHKPLLVSLPYHADESLFRPNAGNPEGYEFGHAQAKTIKSLQHGAVTLSESRVEVNGSDEPIHLLNGEHSRKIFSELRGFDRI